MGAPGLDAPDPIGRKRAGLDQNAGILFGVVVVGDGCHVQRVAQSLSKLFHECGLAGATDPPTPMRRDVLATSSELRPRPSRRG